MIFMVELSIAAVCGLVLFIATNRFHVCETAYAGCGTSTVVIVSNDGLNLVAFAVAVTLIALCVTETRKIVKKKRK